jgi:hypothetical protein
MLPSTVKSIYKKASAHLRKIIENKFNKKDYKPSLIDKSINLLSQLTDEKLLLGDDHNNLRLWQSFKDSIVLTCAVGLCAAVGGLVIGSVAMLCFITMTLSFSAQLTRNLFANDIMSDYKIMSRTGALNELSKDQRVAFIQGCEAAQSLSAQAKSCFPTEEAFWNPHAYYAGYGFSTLRDDYKLAGKPKLAEQADKFIKKISRPTI